MNLKALIPGTLIKNWKMKFNIVLNMTFFWYTTKQSCRFCKIII